ncbi:MAG: sigma 54-interacting transcriptional regulator [Candidatus Riflebacteria bacterium]|nr:sigma 54-interacting transcriptional regulator [Candidatus Riflebacteria bacterium]
MAPRRVPLEGPELIIGRDPDAGVCLEHAAVSRRHARIVVVEGAVFVEDLSKRSGVRVRGAPVKRERLNSGDEVAVGPYRIVLEQGETGSAPGVEAGGIVSRAGLDVLAALLEGFDIRLPSQSYLANLLGALLCSVGAERGFLYSVDLRRARARRVFSRSVDGANPALAVSESLILQVARDRSPLLLLELDPAQGSTAAASIARLARDDLQSVIICPMVIGSRLVGVLYVDSRVKIKSFRPDDVKLLQSVSHVAARLLDSFQAREELESENARLWHMVEETESQGVPVERLIAPESPARQDLELCQRAATRDVTVLIAGETGTGKEVMAGWIHRHSGRSMGPFVPLNCAAVPESLLESELFGHSKGAFTGATEDRAGVLEMAHGGTLFLDEVGELSPASQAKLLRAIQERVVVRIGETRPRPVDFRLVAATHRNLQTLIAEGGFREDLYYRLNVFQIALCPLRNRPQDVPLLVSYFLATLARRMGSPVHRCGPGVMEALSAYSWPGNIRQLRNAVERALVVEVGDELSLGSFPHEVLSRLPPEATAADAAEPAPAVPVAQEEAVPAYAEALREFERGYFSGLVKLVGHNVSAMARHARLTRFTIYRKLGQIGLGSSSDPEQS